MSTSFDLKLWLDRHVVPLLGPESSLALHSVLQNRPPSAERPVAILVWTVSKEPQGWAPAIKRLLAQPGCYFDFCRAPQTVPVAPDRSIWLFGGDGAPYVNAAGMAMARLYRRCDDGIELIMEVGHRFPTGAAAAAAVKDFFALFEGTAPLELVARYMPLFGTG